MTIHVDCELDVLVSNPSLKALQVDTIINPVRRGNVSQVMPVVSQLPDRSILAVSLACVDRESSSDLCFQKESSKAALIDRLSVRLA
jgi:hypothetical protein